MVIGGEGVGEVMVAHHFEGDAVGKGPLLVGAAGVEVEALGDPGGILGEDGGAGVGTEAADEFREHRAMSGIGEVVAQFDQYIIAGQEKAAILLVPFDALGVQFVRAAEEGDVKASIGENGRHDLAWP
jgi:hypothetical protein